MSSASVVAGAEYGAPRAGRGSEKRDAAFVCAKAWAVAPTKPEICRERDHRSPSAKRALRLAYEHTLRRVLERYFAGVTIARQVESALGFRKLRLLGVRLQRRNPDFLAESARNGAPVRATHPVTRPRRLAGGAGRPTALRDRHCGRRPARLRGGWSGHRPRGCARTDRSWDLRRVAAWLLNRGGIAGCFCSRPLRSAGLRFGASSLWATRERRAWRCD